MPIEMKMPDLATTGSDVTIIRWLIEPGQPVKRGDLLVEVETDKAAVEVESIADGVLERVLVAAGDEVSSGQVIAIIAGAGEPMAAAPSVSASPGTALPSAPPAAIVSPAAAPAGASSTPPTRGGMFARNREMRASESAAPASATSAKAPAARSLPMSAAQRAAGRRLLESWQSVPHFYLEASFNAEPMIARRSAASTKLVWDAFFVYAAGRALGRFASIASRFDGDSLTAYEGASIGVAVDSDGELFVISARFDAEPEAISGEIADAAQNVKAGDPEARRLKPGALTITNLGGTKVERFSAIVNPPEAAILAFGRVAPAPVVIDGAVAIQQRGQITLSADHRVVSGKYAAQFLSAVVDELEAL